MSIQHLQFQEALAQLTEDIRQETQKSDSKNRLFLTKAVIQADNSVWKFSSSIIFDDSSGYITYMFDDIVDYIKQSEIKEEIDTSIDNDVLDVFGVHKSIEIADKYIKNSQEIAEATLFHLLNDSNLKERIWRVDYQCKDHRGQYFYLVAKVNVDTAELLSTVIERVESDKD